MQTQNLCLLELISKCLLSFYWVCSASLCNTSNAKDRV